MMGLAVVDGDLLAGRDRPQRIELDPAWRIVRRAFGWQEWLV
jgi:hypothetical protein